MTPFVVDLFHGDAVQDFHAARDAGIVGIIHKASQGLVMKDKAYALRREMAKAAGLKWGAYHFNSGGNVHGQVDHFLECAQPDSDTLMCLDYEDTDAQMSIEQACDFLDVLGTRLGRKPIIYSGNRLKEQLPKATQATRQFIASHKLWLAQYGPVAKVTEPWDKYFLWQFTGDGIGPSPHSIPGIKTQGIDLSTYAGTPADLAKEWAQ